MICLFRGWSKERGQDASRDYKKHTYCGKHLHHSYVTLHPAPTGDDELKGNICPECLDAHTLSLLARLP